MYAVTALQGHSIDLFEEPPSGDRDEGQFLELSIDMTPQSGSWAWHSRSDSSPLAGPLRPGLQIRSVEVCVRAIVIHGYGGPEVLNTKNSLTQFREPARFLSGWRRPASIPSIGRSIRVSQGLLANDLSCNSWPRVLGTVETVGAGVETLAPGDKVFAAAP